MKDPTEINPRTRHARIRKAWRTALGRLNAGPEPWMSDSELEDVIQRIGRCVTATQVERDVSFLRRAIHNEQTK